MDEGLLNDLLECSVCLERLDTSSRVLPCQHTFCIKCLKEIVQSHKELRCPECRVLVEVRLEELPPNVLLMRILEGMRGRPNRPPNNNSSPQQLQQPLVPAQTVVPHHLHHHHHHPTPSSHAQFPGHPVQQQILIQQDSPGNYRFRQQQQQTDPSRQQQQHATEFVPNTSMPHARAVYDYLSKEPGDLSFKKGDVILLRRKIDTHWYYGECGGKQGAFPMTYAKVIIPLPVMPVPQCKALYDFRMAAPDEDGCLAFDKGAVITVIRRVDENWAEGKLQDKIGIFPIAFVEMNTQARTLMKISNSVGGRSAPIAPHSEPIMGVSMLQAGQPNRMDPAQNAYRQPQMSISSPVPTMGSSVQVPQPHPMSQSQPVPSNHSVQPQAYQSQSTAQTPSSETQNEPDLIQLVYGSHANAAQISAQNLQAASIKHHNPDGSGQSNSAAQEAFQKVRANIKKCLSSSYHATNNLSSDSSSTTTTPSFGGSSVTTTPNTSSSNTSSSESNTPSSPASPAYKAQVRNNAEKNVSHHTQSSAQNNYCNVVPKNMQGASYTNVVIEDANTSRSHDSSMDSSGNNSALNVSNHSLLNSDNRSNNSPVQNAVAESPTMSNISSPQIAQNAAPISVANHVSLELTSTMSQNVYQSPTNNREVVQIPIPTETMSYSNSGYTLLANSQQPGNPFLHNNSNLEGVSQGEDSPRHGQLIVPTRGSHSSQLQHREKRHSLTPGGQNLTPQQNSTSNRHSMEYMLSGNHLAPVSQSKTGPPNSSTSSGKESNSQFFVDIQRKVERDVRDVERKRSERERELKLPAIYVALYPYKPQKADELELKKGGVYMVLEICYDGWYKGCPNGSQHKCGVFPGNYVVPAQSRSKHRSGKSSSSEQKVQNSKSGNSSNSTAGPSSGKKKGESSEQPLISSSQQSPQTPAQPPDLPPRSGSPTNSAPNFPWTSAPKNSTPTTSKSSEKSKEKTKGDKSATSMSLIKRLAMKKCKSPPPPTSGACQNPGFSMDNPVFEDCSVPSNHQPVHVRSGSCPSQLLDGGGVVGVVGGAGSGAATAATVGAAGGARLASAGSRAAHTLGPGHHRGGRTRPSLANATLAAPIGHHLTQAQRSTAGEGPWQAMTSRPAHQHRKSHSLDAGQQLRTKDSTATRERFRCVVAYPPNSEYELELQVDDVVVVHRKWGDGWYRGTHERTGRTGLFPASFVEAC